MGYLGNLSGDVKGSLGPPKFYKRLRDTPSFKEKGYTKEDAITQARMAYILQKDQYNGLDEYPSMWQPPSEKLIHEPKLWRTKGRDK